MSREAAAKAYEANNRRISTAVALSAEIGI